MIIVFILSLSIVSAVNDGAIVGQWRFNNTLADELNLTPGTPGNFDGDEYQPAKFNETDMTAVCFDGTNDFVDFGDVTFLDGKTEMTFSYWMNTSGQATWGTTPIAKGGYGQSAGAFDNIQELDGGDRYQFVLRGNGGLSYNDYGGAVPWIINRWNHFTVTLNSSDHCVRIYVNGKLNNTGASCAFDTFKDVSYSMRLANAAIGQTAKYWKGCLGDFIIWNESLSPAEVSTLYAEYGETPAGTDPDNVGSADYLTPPLTPYTVNVDPYNVTWTASTDAESGSNLTYRVYLNGSLTSTTNSTHYNLAFSTEKTVLLRVDVSEWDNLTRWVAGDNMTLTYDETSPIIQSVNPNNFFSADNTTIISDASATSAQFNFTLLDNNDLYAIQAVIDRAGSPIFNVNWTNLTGTNYVWAPVYDVSGTKGPYNVTITVWDSHTDEEIPEWKNKKGSNWLEFEKDAGKKVTVIAEEAISASTTKHKDRYDFGFDYPEDDKTKERKFIVVGSNKMQLVTGSGYAAHFVDWETKQWIDFEGAGEVKKISKIKDGHYSVTLTGLGKNVKFNSIGGLNNNTYYYSYIQNDAPAIISSGVTSYSNTTYHDIVSYGNATDADGENLTYHYRTYKNGALFSTGSVSEVPENTYLSIFNVSSTDLTTFDTWLVSLRASDGLENSSWLNSSSIYIRKIVVDECNATVPYVILNITYYDEINDIQLNATNTYNLNFDDGQVINSIIGSFNTSYYHQFCTDLNPAYSDYSWNYYGTMSISNDDYLTRNIAITDSSPYQATNNPETDLELLLISASDSSTVVFSWLTTEYQNIDGTLRVYSCDENGTRTLVESVPILQSTAVSNLQLYFSQYSYEVIIGSVLYQELGYYTCHVEASTSPTYYVNTRTTNADELAGLYFAQCDLEKTGNSTALLTWGPNPESPDDNVTACFIAKRLTGSGWTTIHENCTTSTSGSYERTIPLNGNSYIVSATLSQNGQTRDCAESLDFYANTPADEEFGSIILLGVVIVLMMLAFIFDSPVMKVGALIVALIVLGASGFTRIGFMTLLSIVGYLAIILWTSRSKK